ncbi:conserved Plasmodium protein, unknown function [Plasmodium berghei]|uniref:Fam-b protein n=2 Tax=Plasmodium berghei TaxID=5821 RepID=A0A509AL99_PLABA|nr:conserved Plasmodium protein, unknown function [Plasmodium berghei ANKA]CXI69685.1 conserved Plasmodium protein, unknown function [Plasmodium berghei]SCM24244.1 conserved Plasmodium protein, unknown function [Plasmodium berghei]SCN27026.1 conserved Plasmodium protein, unknown function [Plasmodium berghei]SCO61471.1 conserved Plasmodium protein, unknown function [Plasmodium berghei]SCO63449.1 conserved Plasmodium protein, unknown function [Plasmodium berghei]|eukprot:XP_034422643.1 conserved Plasmodium protein, unknown function [Plasmodium berghei ANKA]
MTKVCIVYWLFFCLFYFEVVRGKSIAAKWENFKNLNTGNNGHVQIDYLINKDMRDNYLDKRTKKSHMNKNSNKLRNIKKSNIKKNGISIHKSSNNHTFLSLKTNVEFDNKESINETKNEDESDDNEETIRLTTDNEVNNISNGNNKIMSNQMHILRDITDKIKADKTVKNIGKINEIDIPTIAQEERKIDDFHEYENKAFQNIRKNKENIYKMINTDLDILLKPAQKEYMKVAKVIKGNLLREYEEILQEELLEE